MANAKHDDNWVPTLIAVSSADGVTPLPAEIDPGTGELLVKASVSVSGADGAIVDGVSSSIKATVKDLSNSNPLTVAIVDTSGDQIASFGGGVQYTEGDSISSSPTGTVILFREGGGGTASVVSAASPLPVALYDDGVGLATSNEQLIQSGYLTTLAGAVSGTEMQVDILTMPTVTVDNGGTFAVQESGSALTALQLIDDPIFADDAAYTLSTSKGNVLAGVAVQTDGTDPAAVSAEGNAAALRTDMNRILLVNTTPPRLTSATENNATAQTNNPILSAPGAGLSLYITDIVVSNGATAGSIKFVEDTAGTPVIKVQETYMAINGGAVMNFKTPIRITANKDFGYTSTTVTTHSITVSGYIAP